MRPVGIAMCDFPITSIPPKNGYRERSKHMFYAGRKLQKIATSGIFRQFCNFAAMRMFRLFIKRGFLPPSCFFCRHIRWSWATLVVVRSTFYLGRTYNSNIEAEQKPP